MSVLRSGHNQTRRYPYPAIKRWFRKMYPEVENFGIEESDNEAVAERGAKYEAVMVPLVKNNAADSELAMVG